MEDVIACLNSLIDIFQRIKENLFSKNFTFILDGEYSP